MYTSALLALLFVVNRIQSQTGEGCWNQYLPCQEAGQVRIDAIHDPRTGSFIGGCYCGCDYTAIYDPTSPFYCPSPKTINYDPYSLSGDCACQCPPNYPQPSDCTPPHIYNSNACLCECPNEPSSCPAGQTFNYLTCKCECYPLGVPGDACMAWTGAAYVAIPNSIVLPDCTCQCAAHAPVMSDCTAVGRVYGMCDCECPVSSCAVGQTLNKDTCVCECPPCQADEVLWNAPTCDCRKLGTPIVPVTPPGPYAWYCCHPLIDNFEADFGRCWGFTSYYECNGEQYGRCKWDESKCHQGKPQCFFRNYVCAEHTQCCSGVCKTDGLCR